MFFPRFSSVCTGRLFHKGWCDITEYLRLIILIRLIAPNGGIAAILRTELVISGVSSPQRAPEEESLDGNDVHRCDRAVVVHIASS